MIKMNNKLGYANLALCSCARCEGEFIISTERFKRNNREYPVCPYCNYRARIRFSTTDDNREEIELGGLTITETLDFDIDIETDEYKKEMKKHYVENLKMYNFAYRMMVEDTKCRLREFVVLGEKDFSDILQELNHFNTENALQFYTMTQNLKCVLLSEKKMKDFLPDLTWLN